MEAVEDHVCSIVLCLEHLLSQIARLQSCIVSAPVQISGKAQLRGQQPHLGEGDLDLVRVCDGAQDGVALVAPQLCAPLLAHDDQAARFAAVCKSQGSQLRGCSVLGL